MGFFGQYFKAAAVRSPRILYVFAAAAGPVSGGGAALAGEWNSTPRLTVSTIFTDNANDATDREDRNSDFLTTVSPGIALAGTGGRFSLNLNYSHTRFLSYQDTTDQSATNTLAANGRVEVWDRVAFIDTSASVTRQVIDSTRPTSAVDTGSGTNRTTVQTASLQPFFLHHFGTWLETESRTRLDMTRTRTEEIADTSTVGETFSFNSGRRFSVFTFSGLLVDDKTSRAGGAPATRERTATTNYRLRVLPNFSLLSSAGWESVHDPSLTDEPNGFTWNGGFAWQPNSRSSMELTYGVERQTQTISFDSNYALSNRTSISASYSEQLTSSQELLQEDLSFLVDNGAGVLIDSRTGQIFDATNQNFDFQTSLFRQQVLTISLTAARRLVTYGASVEWERRKTDSTGIREGVISTSLSASRPFSSRLSGTVSFDFSHRDFGTEDQRIDRVGSVSAGLTYILTQQTNLVLDLTRSQTQSTEGANNFNNNTVTLSLTHTF